MPYDFDREAMGNRRSFRSGRRGIILFRREAYSSGTFFCFFSSYVGLYFLAIFWLDFGEIRKTSRWRPGCFLLFCN